MKQEVERGNEDLIHLLANDAQAEIEDSFRFQPVNVN